MAQGPALSGQRKTRPNARAIVFVTVFFILILMALVLQSPLSKIRSIRIVGAKALSATRLLQETGLATGLSMWKIEPSQIRARMIRQEPQLSDVTVHVHYLSGQVDIDITEKSVVAVWQQRGQWYRILNDGTVLDELPSGDSIRSPILTSTESLSIVKGKPLPNNGLQRVCEQLAHVSPSIRDMISEVHFVASNYWDVVMYMRDGYQIDISGNDMNQSLTLYPAFRKWLTDRHVGPGIIYLDQGSTFYHSYLNKSDSTKGG